MYCIAFIDGKKVDRWPNSTEVITLLPATLCICKQLLLKYDRFHNIRQKKNQFCSIIHWSNHYGQINLFEITLTAPTIEYWCQNYYTQTVGKINATYWFTQFLTNSHILAQFEKSPMFNRRPYHIYIHFIVILQWIFLNDNYLSNNKYNKTFKLMLSIIIHAIGNQICQLNQNEKCDAMQLAKPLI